jgi:dipeptidase E
VYEGNAFSFPHGLIFRPTSEVAGYNPAIPTKYFRRDNILFRPINKVYELQNQVFSVGDLSQGSHLFPFRTEKLSLVEPMILFMGKVGCRQHRVLDSKNLILNNRVFCYTHIMKLLLTSGGITNKKIADALFELAGKPAGEIVVAFIPTAMNAAQNDKAWFADDLYRIKQQNFKKLDIVDISALPKEIWQPKLEAADILFFSGGVTLHLMKWMNDSGLKELLPELLKTRVYAGISAGSMIMSPSLELTSKDHKILYKEKFGYETNEGLGYVDFYFRPHLNSPDRPENQKEFLTEIAKKLPAPLYALDNQMAIKVIDGKVELIGEGEYLIFNK